MNLFAPNFGDSKFVTCRACNCQVPLDGLSGHAVSHVSTGTAKVSKVKRSKAHRRALDPGKPIAWDLVGQPQAAQ